MCDSFIFLEMSGSFLFAVFLFLFFSVNHCAWIVCLISFKILRWLGDIKKNEWFEIFSSRLFII